MTETYYARISTEREREIANWLHDTSGNGSGKYLEYDCDEDFQYTNEPIGTELPFSDFIQRFFPLTVVEGLAKCHGKTVVLDDWIGDYVERTDLAIGTYDPESEEFELYTNPEDMRKDDGN